MSSKFSPKFTIATAYPMMFSSADLKHIESEMLCAISTNSTPRDSVEPSNTALFDAIETPTDFYAWTRDNESQRLQTLRQLERLWQSRSADSPKKEYKKRGTT